MGEIPTVSLPGRILIGQSSWCRLNIACTGVLRPYYTYSRLVIVVQERFLMLCYKQMLLS